jgi:hypothetical protein
MRACAELLLRRQSIPMGFLDRFLGKRTDPTLGWGVLRPPMPDFDLTVMRFGPLRFGDSFDAAAFLGRPDSFKWSRDDYCELLYATSGFQIDYDDGKFAYLAFFIGPDDYLPNHSALEFSKPQLRGCTPDGIQLSQETDQATLERLFGAAESVDTDPEETILYYTKQNVTMEFEIDEKSGSLKRWNLYPK